MTGKLTSRSGEEVQCGWRTDKETRDRSAPVGLRREMTPEVRETFGMQNRGE